MEGSRRVLSTESEEGDLQNSSYPTKAEFNNCFIIHSKFSLFLKDFRYLDPQSRPQDVSVNGSIVCSGLHF